MWVNEDREFTIVSMKSWLEVIDIDMYTVNYEGKSAVAHILITNLKNKCAY